MKKLLNKGRAIVSCISVLAILAVSLLSMFTGVTFIASAEGETTEGEATVSYPLNGSYDADVVILEGVKSYIDADTTSGTVTDFTEFDKTFWLTAEGDGTVNNPYIIKTANQFAAVATGNLVDQNGAALDTAGLAFKVADEVKAFNMNNTDSAADLSGDMTAEQVEAALGVATIKSDLNWSSKSAFKGCFDGNGVVIYGLKVDDSYAGLFGKAAADATFRNFTLKNSYFLGDRAGSLFADAPEGSSTVTFENIVLTGNVVVCKRSEQAETYGGVMFARAGSNRVDVKNCLVYGNIAKHVGSYTKDGYTKTGYDVTYGMLGRTVKVGINPRVENSIILDCLPFTAQYGYASTSEVVYSNVYTNMTDVKITNTMVEGKSEDDKYTTTYTGGLISDASGKYKILVELYNRNNAGKTEDLSKLKNEDSFYAVTAEDIKGAAAKTELSGLDWEKWTVNESGYPTPKIYCPREYTVGTAWSGEVALTYSSGVGTKESPYIVNTAEELALMLMTAKAGEYFKLGADIIINDTSAANWTDNAKQWFTSNDVPVFEGVLDGNGYTVSGIYYDGTQAGESAGLIPVLGSAAQVKNIKIANSKLNGNSGDQLGAVVGSVADYCALVVKVDAVTVEASVEFSGNAAVGGIIGKVGYSSLKMNDCISMSNGLFSEVTGQAAVKRCVSAGAYPFKNVQYIAAENVYTNTQGTALDGVTVVANADMLGVAAETSMPGLAFPTSWKTVDGGYPAPTGAEASANGVKDEVWTGAIAPEFAAYPDGTYGDGSAEKPYLIETAEQLARFVTNIQPGSEGNLTYYKLTADIYLNDVEGNLWKDKVGCTEWFTQLTTGKNSSAYKWFSLDGDGHVVYGMYLNETGDEYYRAGLVPYLNTGAVIKNVGISEAYLMGNPQQTDDDCIGAIAGQVPTAVFDDAGYPDAYKNPLYTHDSSAVREIQWNYNFNLYRPQILNCFVDHTCYIAGRYAGGLVGKAGGPVRLENCAVTATIEGATAGGLVGNDNSLFSTYTDCISLPQNSVRAAEGGANVDWRNTSNYWVTEVYQVYYFAIKPLKNTYFIKISNPLDRVGTAAQKVMTGLDWEGNSEDGTQDLWRVVDGGTPVLTVFAKHRSDEELEKFSDKSFSPPEVTVSLSSNGANMELDPLVGRMYSKITLPTLERDGYEFTGWYAFADCSVEYPVDYFPPRSLTLYAGWEPKGIIQNFESYTETIWDNDSNCWTLNKPGAKGGYKNAYVRNGSKSMHLLDTNTEPADCLLNYEEMLKPGTAYTITFWVTTDKENNPATLLSLVHNSKPDYLNSAVAVENMAVATGLTAGEWVQYSYSFTAQTKWISIRATAGSSLYFDDIMIAELDGTLEGGKVVNLGTGSAAGGALSPNTGEAVSVAVLISAIMACAVIAVISRKNLVEIVEE